MYLNAISIVFLPIFESNFISGTSKGGIGDVIKISFSSLTESVFIFNNRVFP